MADILAQLAQSAGRRQFVKGQILGDLVAGASHIPAQIMADREHARLLAHQQAQQDAAAGYAHDANARANADQVMQDQTFALAQQRAKVRNDVIHAGFVRDPQVFNLEDSLKAVSASPFPDLEKDVREIHDRVGKPYQTNPELDTRDPVTNAIITPGIKKPSTTAPTAAGFAAAANDPTKTPEERAAAQAALTAVQSTPGAAETARHNKEMERIGAMSAGRTVAAQQETARHNRAMEQAADPFAGAAPNAGGSDLLDKMPAAQRAQAQALVEGRRALDPRLASKPYGQAIINAAYAMDPSFDTGNYNARVKARTDLTTPGGTGGKTINALNTAIQHAGKLSDLIETLDNSNIPLVNAVVNPLKSATGNTAVTNFNTVAPQLAKEIERVWRGAGGTAGEIHDLIDTIGQNKGKQQQREALQQFVDLAKGKLDALQTQRDAVMGTKAGATIPVLYDQNKPIVDTIAQRAGVKSGAAPSAPAGWKYVPKPGGGWTAVEDK